jgi:transglutaminase-like putative cysteine protease
MPNTVECASQSEATRQPVRRFEIVDSCEIGSMSNQDESIELWYPIIPDTPYQRVLDISISAPSSWAMYRELEHGNSMLYAKPRNSIGKEPRIQIRYLVERTAVSHAIHLADVRPLETPALFERWLRAEQFVDVDAKTRALAREIVGAETNVLFQARVIYDYVTGAMTYDAAQQSWKGSTEHALMCSVGNCNDIHALFISLCRSVGIPARLILGQALEAPLPGQDACELCGYHCWAEYFAPGLGWVPVDASCACKYGKHHLFGDLEMNHIAWSVGRDVELNPLQKGERLLFFAGPYAEINGVAHRSVERRVHFNEVWM